MDTSIAGVYLLGCLNRHITVHSQQRRAINLIHSIGAPALRGKRIGIIGAGFGGLTAAAYALATTTAKVTVLEAAPRPLWVQDQCENRWLHPGIYDWPFPGALDPKTNLPVLNWRADTAARVASQVRSQWERLASTSGDRISVQYGANVQNVRQGSDGPEITHQSSRGTRTDPFDFVILAAGFGLEDGPERGRISYWNDADGLDHLPDGSPEVLVSGFGDGALADVLRLCLPGIRQDALIELLRHVDEGTRDALIQADRNRNSSALAQLYASLRVEPVIRDMKQSRPPLARVTLAGEGHLYGTSSAIVNRFLISQLRHAISGDLLSVVDGRIEIDPSPRPPAEIEVTLGDGRKRTFARAVLRWGPKPVLGAIALEPRWDGGDKRSKHWLDLPQALDSTRIPLWGGPTSAVPVESPRQDLLAYQSSNRPWALILQPEASKTNWRVFVRYALQESSRSGELNHEPLVLNSNEALRSDMIEQTVRALCAAQIVIADVTGYDEAVMMLLGVRASVRRGITIPCTTQPRDAGFWQGLPFNLRELSPISFHDRRGHDVLTDAVKAALEQREASSMYLDLPVFDYVRGELVDGATAGKVLLLRAFTGYDDARIVHVTKQVQATFTGRRAPVPVESIIDQNSPRLASQRLYEAIRHSEACVVDLTFWRPNVLFELGVRLATRRSGTFCLIDETAQGQETYTPSRRAVASLVNPFTYDQDTKSFSEGSERLRDPSPIFGLAAEHFEASEAIANRQIGTILSPADRGNPLEKVEINALYAESASPYAAELVESSFEALCAAWYYLTERHQPRTMQPVALLDPKESKLFSRYKALVAVLTAELTVRKGEPDMRLADSIEDHERAMENTGLRAMAELLEDWRNLRVGPPWQSPFRESVTVEDLASYQESLQRLARTLREIDNPVCKIPLQGVEYALRQLTATIQAMSPGATL